MYRLVISTQAQKDLNKFKKTAERPIKLALAEIKEDPFLGKTLSRELSNRFSYRVGVYRIIYTINQKDKIVEVLSAGHRSNIYS